MEQDDKSDYRKKQTGVAHQALNMMPSELALERDLERRRLARERDKDDPKPTGKRYRKFGKR